jgi:hypothetical protein
MCHLHTHLAQWEQAIEWCGKSIASGRANFFPFVDLAAANAWAGHDKEAKEAAAQLQKVYPGFTVQTWGRHPLDRRSELQRAISADRRRPAQGGPAGGGEEDGLIQTRPLSRRERGRGEGTYGFRSTLILRVTSAGIRRRRKSSPGAIRAGHAFAARSSGGKRRSIVLSSTSIVIRPNSSWKSMASSTNGFPTTMRGD